MSEQLHTATDVAAAAPAFRIDPKLHQILYTPASRPTLEPTPEPEALPEPPYPIHPDPQPMTEKQYQRMNALRDEQRKIEVVRVTRPANRRDNR